MLRNYQINAINDFENCQEKNILLQMPTGSGKTFTFCEIAKRYFTVEIKKVLILVHRQELLKQARESLGERVFCIEKGIKLIPNDYDYYVGMVETLHRRIKILPKFGLVIIDECHIGNFKKMPFFAMDDVRVLGVTATPVSDPPLSQIFQKMIMPTQINELINEGYLLNCDTYGVASDLVGKQKFKIKMGEFDEKELEDFYSSEKMVLNVIEAYWKYSAGKKTLIFNVNLNHNSKVFEALKKEGLNVYSITGETSNSERTEILQAFKKQNDAILCNVGVFTTGFDEPSIQTIFLNRATKSLALFLQMIGRGSRPFENKEKFTVIDLGKNTLRHGYYDGFFDWETFFKNGSKKESKGVGAMPIKECPQCQFTQHSRKIICENCGFSFEEEKLKQEKQEKEQKLYLLVRDKPIEIPFDKLFSLAEERSWKPYAVIFKINEHILNYQNKYKSIVTNEFCESEAIIGLKKWCEKYDKKFNKWHQDFIIEQLNKKRNEINGIGNTTTDCHVLS